MVNRITNTPIYTRAYNHWGLITNGMQCGNCVRQSDGTLWAVFSPTQGEFFLYRSTDNGFSWEQVRNDVENITYSRRKEGLNTDGPFAWLVLNEAWDKLDVYMADHLVTDQYDIERRRYSISSVETDTASNTTIETDISHGQFAVSYNNNEAFVFFVDQGANLISVIRAKFSSTSISSQVDSTVTPVYNEFAVVCDKNSVNHILAVLQEGGVNNPTYFTYDSENGFNNTDVIIESYPGTSHNMKDAGIAFDGYDTLCAFYTTVSGADLTKTYALSTDSGSTWDVNDMVMTSGHNVYMEEATSDYRAKTGIIGGRNGFLLTYTEDNSDTIPKTYVRQLTTTDGSTYTLGAEKEIATNSSLSSDSITGAHFFYPNEAKLMDFDDPGQVRVAFTIGSGISTLQEDLTPVTFGQELLSQSAYASTLDTDLSTYSQDTADANSILVTFNIVGSPNDNSDFYSLGMTGDFTTQYIDAFNTIGTSIRLKQFEPDANSEMDDRSSYNDPSESTVKVLFDPLTYSFPTPDLTATNQTNYIEQDVRKIYLPPTQHLSRTFTVNIGGHLKRTVWLCEFGGNEYELSQVVPRFINNQICYYEANAYVVGPSRDPFSRTVLVSET